MRFLTYGYQRTFFYRLEVPVPVFIPSAFQKCQSSSLSIAAGNDFCIVITANGKQNTN
jgi:hypothetical protein